MSTLYRKYRPQSFSDVTDQEHVIRTITNQIAADKTAHAYLFSGPRGVGKTTVARLLAKAVNCDKKKVGNFEPCNECSSCAEISAGRNIDVIEIDAASHTGVDNVRENIIENAQFKPTKSPRKIFIIDEVHMLSASAFNALLKTLEEPPAHVIFALATTELHKLPATIVSRCQRFNFKRISHAAMKKRLEQIAKAENVKVDKKVIDRVINKSDGALRDAESLLGQILSLDVKEIKPENAEMILPTSDSGAIIGFIENIARKETASALTLIEKLSVEGMNVDQFFYDVIEVLRGIMKAQAGQEKALEENYNDTDVKRAVRLAKEIPDAKLIQMIESALGRRREAKTSPIPQLPLELFAVEHAANKVNAEPPNVQALPSEGGVVGTAPSELPKKHPITDSIKSTLSHLAHRRQIKTTLEEAQAKWPDIVKRVTEENPSLSFILKMGELKSLDESGIRIAVPYSFHKDKLEESKNKRCIEKHMQDALQEKICFACEIESFNAPPPGVIRDDLEIKNLAAEFEGEIVE